MVLGLETVSDPSSIRALLSRLGPDRTIVSLDLDDGRPRTPSRVWQDVDACCILEQLVDFGVRRLILLDIRRVGMGQGTGTIDLLRRARALNVDWQIVCGGGIRGLNDLRQLAAEGCDAVLLASARHDGRLGRTEVRELHKWGR